jgi:uncharacterized protein (DUF1501 family)
MHRRQLLTHGAALLGSVPLALHARLALSAPVPMPSGTTGTTGSFGLLGPDNRLVVVMLRGALDGLAAVPAVGDPAWRGLRPNADAQAEQDGGAPSPLDGTFALHPQLGMLHQWWQDGSLLILHAVAQPYRERSHFDAQQMLESGGTRPFEWQTGWLGRAMAAAHQPGLALVPHVPLALRGPGTDTLASNWAPTRQPAPAGDLLDRAQRLYADDPQFAALWAQAMAQQGMAGRDEPADRGPGGFTALAEQAGRFLSDPAGPRLAWLELDGWDTHTAQAPRLKRALSTLDSGLSTLRGALGPLWARTSVFVMTEFGRSAVPNGTGGTDHGTAGIALLAGGAVRGGRVLADWPGLAPAQLLQGRDLRPTQDLRALQSAVLQAHWGLDSGLIGRSVLPGAPAPLTGLYRHTAATA